MFWLFFLLWLVYSQRVTVDIVVTGLIISAAMYWFMQARIHHYRPAPLRRDIRNLPLVLSYGIALVREVIVSGIVVMKMVLSKTLEIDPILCYFTTDLNNRFEQVVLANAIILTPGTTVVGLEDGEYCVHSLTRGLAKDIDNSTFVRRLRVFEERRATSGV